ncbi:MAG TPA: hypothetical protein VGN75_07635 [Kaistia sp.]|nr:hypothetical protein [Kaistia sp.]
MPEAAMSNQISEASYQRIKSATRDLVKACGGVERAGTIVNMSTSEVSRWQSASALRSIIPLDAVLALEADCGLLLVTSVMASINGRRLADPDSGDVSAMQVMGRYAETVRTVSEMMAIAAVALADGTLTGSEIEMLIRSLGDMQRATGLFQRDLSEAKGGPALKVVGEGA